MRVFSSLPVLALLLLVAAGLPGCGSDPAGQGAGTAIQVNEVTISTEEFNDLIKTEAYNDPEMDISRQSRNDFVDYLIRKELLIQEAIRLKMDRQEEFIKTIETYWESTLIRRLLDAKTAELKKTILITEEEIRAWYDSHAEVRDQPYEAARPSIKKILESEHLAASLEAWTKGLRSGARIHINPSLAAGADG